MSEKEALKILCHFGRISTTQGTTYKNRNRCSKEIKAGKSIGGADGALGDLIKQLTEAALAAEIDSHLSQDFSKNRKNGYTSKTMCPSKATNALGGEE